MHEWLKPYTTGCYIDAKDKSKTWRVGQITSFSESGLSVAFERSKDPDQDFSLTSPNLAPFRKYTYLYTGTNKSLSVQLTSAEIQSLIAKLENLPSTAFEVTQLLRGKFFTTVDYLLEWNFSNNIENTAAFDLFQSALVFFVKYLGMCKEIFRVADMSLMIEGESFEAALLTAWPEVCLIAKKLFGLDPRTSKTLSSLKYLPANYKYCVHTADKRTVLSYFVNFFASLGGFDKILDLVSTTENTLIPLKYLQDLPALELRDYFSQTFDMKWTPLFQEAALERILRTTPEEIQNISCEEVLIFIDRLGKVKGKFSEDSIFAKLIFCNLLLQSSNMTTRLLGLVEITKIVEKHGQSPQNEAIVSDQTLISYLKSLETLKYVLKNCHLELLKKSFSLFAFVAGQKSLGKEDLECLWKDVQDLAAEEVAYELFVMIGPFLPEDLQNWIFEATFVGTVKYLKFVAELSKRIGKKGDSLGLEILFKEVIFGDNKENARNCFVEVLKYTKSIETFYLYIDKLMSNFGKEAEVCESILLMLEMMKINFDTFFGCNKNEVFVKIDEKFDGFWEKLENYWKILLATPDLRVDSVKIAIKLWTFTIKSKNFKISILEIQNFHQLVKTCPFPNAEILFFSSLHKMVKFGFSLILKQDIFDLFFLNPQNSNLETLNFELFFDLFIQINKENNLIEVKGSEIHSRLAEQLIGHEKLLEIYFSSSSEEISFKSLDLLTKLNLKLSKSLFPQKPEIWSNFLKTVSENLLKDQSKIVKSLKLLVQFLGTNKSKPEGPLNAVVKFYLISDRDLNSFEVNDKTTTLGHIKEKLSEFYQKPANSIVLQHNNEVYNFLSDNQHLYALKLPWNFLVSFDNKHVFISPNEFLLTQEQFLTNLLALIRTFDPQIAELAWVVLEKTWPMPSLLTKIEDLLVPFDQLLPSDCLYSLVYNLKILKKLTESQNWTKMFKENEGFIFLIKVFTSFNLSSTYPSSLLLDYFSEVFHLLKLSDTFPVELVYKILDSLVRLSNFKEESEQLVVICINAKEILGIIQRNCIESYQNSFSSYPLHDLVVEVLINSELSVLCGTISNFLLEHSNFTPSISELIIFELLNSLPLAVQKKNRDIYWGLVRCYIQELKDTEKVQKTFNLIRETLDSYPNESSSEDCDSNLTGLLSVLCLMMPNPVPLDLFVQVHGYVFQLPSTQHENFPKCKSRLSKKEAFDLIKKMIDQSSEALELLIEHGSNFSRDLSFRTCKSSDWLISSLDLDRSLTGFVGLKNLGCICYLNSCIQQLYCVEVFRKFVLSYGNSGKESLLYQLQVTFSALQHSIEKSFEPRGLCGALMDWEGKPLNVQEQQDADEFINSFLDKIACQVPNGEFNIVHELMSGTLVTEIRGEGDCPHVRQIEEKFFTMPIQVKNQKKLEEGLKEFIAGEILESGNAYQCDSCGGKVRATRRVLVSSLPNILIITLRRFEFNYDFMRRVKLNDVCEFPMDLDMQEFTIPELHSQSEDYFKYKIKGALVHLGTAESGHYYSYIKNGNSWYEFNDSIVIPFDIKDLAKETFGGFEVIESKQRSAYILFYERVNYCDKLPNPPASLTFLEVAEQNQRFCRIRLSFSAEYIDFLMELLHKDLLKTTQFVIKSFFTVVIRSADFTRIVSFAMMIKDVLSRSQEQSDWVLVLISHLPVVKELFLDCPSIEKRKIMVGVIKVAIRTASNEGVFIFTYRWLGALPKAKVPLSHNFMNYFEVLLAIIKVMPELIVLLSIRDRLVEYILGEKILIEAENVEEKAEEEVLGYTGRGSVSREELSRSELGESVEYLVYCLEAIFLAPNAFSIYYEDQKIDFFIAENTLMYFIDRCKTRSCCRSIGKMYIAIGNETKALFIKIAKIFVSLLKNLTCCDLILTGTSDKNSESFVNVIRAFYSFLMGFKPLFPDKMEEILNILMNIALEKFQNNQDPHIVLVYVKKMLINDGEIKKILQKKQKILREVENFLSNAWYNYQNSTKDLNRLKYCIDNFQTIKKLAKNEIKTVFVEDSDSEFRDFEICPGSELLFYSHEHSSWIKTTVTVNCEELICIRYENSSAQKWLHPQSDLLHRA